MPEDLERIVQRALQKDTAKRYRTGLELADELRRSFPGLGRSGEDIAARNTFDAIKQLAFFQDFPDDQIREVIRAGSWQESKKGKQIVREGDSGDSFFIIVSGKARVMKGDKRVGTLVAGDSFGEIGYLAKTRRSAGIVADTDLSVIKIRADRIAQASAACHQRLHEVFLRILIERLCRMTAQVAEL